MPTKFYLTTPIYYVNDKPHIGHAYTSIAADVIARYHRLQNHDVMFLTGTDEHGQKIQKSADAKGMEPQNFVDSLVPKFKELMHICNCTPNDFIRTTEKRHIDYVKNIWQKLEESGQIYLGKYAGWYAVRDECFYSESDIVDGKAPTGALVEWIEEDSYFFRLSNWQDRLLEFYDTCPNFIAPESRRNEVISFVKRGLTDLSVSRTSFNWGIPVPGNDRHVIYVWIDALFNYISAIQNPAIGHEPPAKFAMAKEAIQANEQQAELCLDTNEDFQLGTPKELPDTADMSFWPCDLHIIGKDILIFHAVYWPALLMALNLELPKRIFAHGWWTNEGQKISKSLGNTIDPQDLVDEFGSDYVRYFMMKEISFGDDGNYNRSQLISRVNSDLANNIGNLTQRTASFIYQYCDGTVSRSGKQNQTTYDQELYAKISNTIAKVESYMQEQKIHLALNAIVELGSAANSYMEQMAPWSMRKTGDLNRMNDVLYNLLYAIRTIAFLLQPFVPIGAGKILEMIPKSNSVTIFVLPDKFVIATQPEAVFCKIMSCP